MEAHGGRLELRQPAAQVIICSERRMRPIAAWHNKPLLLTGR